MGREEFWITGKFIDDCVRAAIKNILSTILSQFIEKICKFSCIFIHFSFCFCFCSMKIEILNEKVWRKHKINLILLKKVGNKIAENLKSPIKKREEMINDRIFVEELQIKVWESV